MIKELPNGKIRILTFFAALLFAVALFAPHGMFVGTEAAGTISGRAFQDYNANGVFDNTGGTLANPTSIDAGVQFVTVTAYDSAGVSRGTTVTAADGTYSLAATGTGPYRVEFTNLPAGFDPSARSNDSVGAGTATNSGSTVFFVNDGNTANVNLALSRSEEYCQNNPTIVMSQFAWGDQNGANGNVEAILDFPYWAGTVYTDPTPANYDVPGTHPISVMANKIGTTVGLAYARAAKRIYAAAYFKRHVGFGPGADGIFNNADDPGAIYVINPATNTVVNTFTVPNATTNSHDTTNYLTDNGNIGWNAAGKTSLGGLAISDDESRLFVMNLQNRTLYALDPTTGAVLGSQAVPTTTVPTPGGTAANCAAADVRPFAVKYYRQQLYVGMVCSAESTQNNSNMRAYIYQVDPTTLVFGVSPIFNISLVYNRGFADPGAPAEWRPWFATVVSTATSFSYPQATVSDIEFDGGNLTLALRDRVGDQANDFDSNSKRTAGDVLRACGSFGAWTLETNGRCGGTGTAPQNTGQGPGEGEFFFQDDFSNPANGANYHDDITWGTTLRIAGSSSVVVSGLDPISRFIDPGATFDGGVRWMNTTTGATTRAYRIYNGDGSPTPPDLGKANGLGDLTALCNAAPIEIGNRVWLDTDGNGVQNSGETNIQNVAVQLWGDTNGDMTIDTQLGTATTNANGHYVFGGVGNTNLNSFTCGTTPGSVVSTVSASTDDAEQNLGNSSVSTAGNDLELTADGATLQSVGVRFNNLTIPAGATITNAYIQFIPKVGQTINSGTPAITIRGENSDNAVTFAAVNNNISARAVTAQSVAWSPANWNTVGTPEVTPNISSVVQAIASRPGWASGNSMVFILNGSAANAFRRAESFDGVGGNAPQLFVTYTTNNLCKINPLTKYEVRIPATNFNAGQALSGLRPTSVDSDATANGDSRDSDGVVLAGSEVIKAFTQGGPGSNNHTYDFGFRGGTNIYSVGNRVWFDTNNDGRINAGEVGIGGISMSLFVDANSDGIPDTPGTPVGTVVTDASGYYRFDDLNAGTYVVRANPSNFANAAALAGYQNTTGNTPGDVDSDLVNNGENGVNPTGAANSIQTAGILSNTITLGPGSAEPVSETDLSPTGQGTLDNTADMTVDFGFYCLSLSGTLWNDTGAGPFNNNGQIDAGETRITNLNVRLFDSAGVEIPIGYDGILGTADDGPTGVFTDASGNYSFRCLPPGQYRVVVWGAGGTSSTPTSANPDDNIDNDDNGFPGSGQFNGRTVSGLVTLTPGSTGAAGNNTVTNATGSTANPTVDFGFIVAPTFVKLESFDVYFDGRETIVKWASGEEVDNLGFNVYREAAGRRELINEAPIAGSSLRSSVNLVATGEGYQWIDDKPLEPGTVYYLEDIDMKGYGTLHGPVSPTLRFSPRALWTNPVLLTDLGKAARPSAEREFVGRKASQNARVEKFSASSEDVQWEIAARQGVKISVNHDGWYRVGAEQLRSAGFETAGDNSSWQLFADGDEVAMKVLTDGSVEFFGRGLDLLTADTRVFYLVRGDTGGRRLSTTDGGNADGLPVARSFAVTTERKDRVAYVSSILNGERDNWFGPFVNRNAPTFQNLTVNDPDTQGPVSLRISLQGLTSTAHQVSVRFNDTDLGSVELTNQENRAFEFQLPASALVAGQNRVTLQSFGTGNDVSMVDTVALTYPRRYVAVNDTLRFGVRAGQAVRVGGFSESEIDIFEVRNGRVDRQLLGNAEKVDGTHGFSLSPAGYDRELIAVGRNSSESAGRIDRNHPSTWNRSANKADLVIITPESLYPEAEQLAKLRKGQGLRTEVAAVEDLYDEFSYGVHSPDAVKQFLQIAATTWKVKPRYAILFGDSSFDPRNYIGQVNRDLVPTKLIDTQFMETASDAWLADFNDDGIEDVSLGRLPVGNMTEAGTVVAKLRRYETQPDRQRESSMLIADRGFENYNGVLQAETTGPVDVSRIDRSALTDSQTREAILSGLNAGPMVVTYTGHGSTGLWANYGIFNINDAGSLNNSQMSLYLMMTCLNGYTHNPYGDSLAEAVLRNGNGGAVLVWASSGETYPDVQFEMTRIANAYLFNQAQDRRIGDMIRAAKQGTANQDVRRTWQLMGDPTLVVK